jgi:hypothetical protein
MLMLIVTAPAGAGSAAGDIKRPSTISTDTKRRSMSFLIYV